MKVICVVENNNKTRIGIAERLQQLTLNRQCVSRGLLTTLVLALVCQPIAYAALKSVIWEKGDQTIQIARQDDKSASPNDHPSRMTSEQVAAILGDLRLRYAGEDAANAPTTVFTQQEIDDLSAAVATGLQRARPNEDIIFHLIGVRRLSRGAFVRRNRVSAGRIFVRDGNLNIIFGQVQTAYRKKNVYGQHDKDFYPRNYGNRKSAAVHEVVLQTNAAVRFHQDDSDEVRTDWLVMNPETEVIVAKPAVSAEASVMPKPAPTAEMPSRAESAQQAAPAERTPVPGDTRQESEQAAAATTQPVMPTTQSNDVEKRLETLKRLRDRELISEEAYRAKVAEILRDL